MSTLPSTAFPPYTIFHASLGYVIVCVGIAAMVSRVCIACSKNEFTRDKWRRIHRICGRTWVMSLYFMPITAIWIKPWSVDWDIIAFFIFSMYFALIIGYSIIKIRVVVTNTRLKQVLKYVHGICMIYSWVMLVGAGISFPARAAERARSGNSTAT